MRDMMSSKGMKRLLFATGWILSIACLFYFLRFLIEYWGQVSDVVWDMNAWLTVGASLSLYLLTGLFSLAVWGVFLYGVGERFSLLAAGRVYLVAQFAKYLPGNVGHHIGRVALAERAGMHLPRVILSMLVETIWSTVVMVLLSLGCLFIAGHQWLDSVIGFSPLQELVIGVLILLLGLAAVLWGMRSWQHWKMAEAGMSLPGVAAYISTMAMVIINMLLMSVVVLWLGRYLFGVEHMDYGVVLAGIVVSWALGFLTPGAPAGLGIREVVLVGMLASLGAANAVGIAALLRVITAFGDVVMFAIGLLLPQPRVEGEGD